MNRINFLAKMIKENFIDALGLSWVFDQAGETMWNTGCAVFILLMRWTVKLVVFILVLKAIMLYLGHVK